MKWVILKAVNNVRHGSISCAAKYESVCRRSKIEACQLLENRKSVNNQREEGMGCIIKVIT